MIGAGVFLPTLRKNLEGISSFLSIAALSQGYLELFGGPDRSRNNFSEIVLTQSPTARNHYSFTLKKDFRSQFARTNKTNIAPLGIFERLRNFLEVPISGPFASFAYFSGAGLSRRPTLVTQDINSNQHHASPGGEDMARFDGGWVKIRRKAFLGDINSNFTRGGLFGALVSMANIQDSVVSWKGKPRELERGEICTSIQELSNLGEVDRSTILRHLNYLELRGTLTVEKSNRGIIIKLLKFDYHQGFDAEGPHQDQHQAPHQTHIGHHISPTHIEQRNNKTKKQRNKNSVTAPETDHAKILRQTIRGVYGEAYARRYGHPPIFNAKANSQIKQLAERLGEDAPFVAAFYLTHEDQFYIRQAHTLGPLLANAEALHTQWKLGERITTTKAREIERSESSRVSEAEMSALLGSPSNQLNLLAGGDQ